MPPIRVASDFERRYPEASGRATECAMNLVFTADLMFGEISRLLRPFDLTPASGLVLSNLAESREPLAPREIADRLIVSRATVTGLIDSLERRQYVRRLPHPADRRMLLVEITENGRRVADEFRPVVHRQQRLWFQSLDENEKQSFILYLERIQGGLSDSED
jgi:DNA-binding MarR family transcriptional regulator